MSHWSHGHFKPSAQRPPIEFLHYLPWLFIRRVWYIIFFVFFEVVWLLTTFFLQLLFCFFLFDNFFFYFVLRLKSSILHSHYLLIINHFCVQSGTQRRRHCHLQFSQVHAVIYCFWFGTARVCTFNLILKSFRGTFVWGKLQIQFNLSKVYFVYLFRVRYAYCFHCLVATLNWPSFRRTLKVTVVVEGSFVAWLYNYFGTLTGIEGGELFLPRFPSRRLLLMGA